MAMITKPGIIDSVLLSFHNLGETVFIETKKQIDAEMPRLKESASSIKEFSELVRIQGSLYQNEKIGETTANMMGELKDHLQKYQDIKINHGKAAILAGAILRTITFLTPIPRQWDILETNTPEFYTQAKESEKTCLDHIAELQKSHTEAVDLKNKLLTCINDKTLTWALKRFEDILNNEGKPLSLFARTRNYFSPYVFTPVIPKPEELTVKGQKDPSLPISSTNAPSDLFNMSPRRSSSPAQIMGIAILDEYV